MKECIACAEEIKENAKLCKHCGTRQDDPEYQNSEIDQTVVASETWEDGLANGWENFRSAALQIKGTLENPASPPDELLTTIEMHSGCYECSICSFLEYEFSETTPTVLEISLVGNSSASADCLANVLESAELMPEYYQDLLPKIVAHPNANEDVIDRASALIEDGG